jgi:SAM-dependent methyltransferase
LVNIKKLNINVVKKVNMKTPEELKSLVREKYSVIAGQDVTDNMASCCGAGGCSTEVYNIMTDDYTAIAGYESDADLGLGCGIPTESAVIKPGDVVVDLGSGAGNDAFVARRACGSEGKVVGIDFTDAMLTLAKQNAEKLGYTNVTFRKGDIENIPMTAGQADVVISNCVLNLVPDKAKVFSEIYRILKVGGHFSISDVVITENLPEALLQDAEMYAGCVSGAILKSEYLQHIQNAGFTDIRIYKDKPIVIPDDILVRYLSKDEISLFSAGDQGIRSITVYGVKPEVACCGDSACC